MGLAPNARGLFLGDYMGLVSNGANFYPLYVRTTSDITNRNDVFMTPMVVTVGTVETAKSAANNSMVSSATSNALYSPTDAHKQSVHENMVRAMDARIPGWAARRGLTRPPTVTPP